MKAQNVPRAQDGPKRVSILILRDLLVAPRPFVDPSWATLGFSRGGVQEGILRQSVGLEVNGLGMTCGKKLRCHKHHEHVSNTQFSVNFWRQGAVRQLANSFFGDIFVVSKS